MKKIISLIIVATLALTSALSLSSCTDSSADTTIKVGASVTPHAEILNAAKDILAEKGYTLEVVEYNDYVLPNTATESGELDANYFQHIVYLNDFNKENGTHLVVAGKIHYEPFGIYAGKTSSLSDLKDGAIVSVPNDTTNEARALLLLEAQGLIKLRDGAGLTATKLDIIENPKNLEIKELEAAQLVRSLGDVDISVINGNYAIQGNLKVSDALAIESGDSEAIKDNYVNVIAVKEGNENTPKIKALVEALTSDKIRDFINEKYESAVVPIF